MNPRQEYVHKARQLCGLQATSRVESSRRMQSCYPISCSADLLLSKAIQGECIRRTYRFQGGRPLWIVWLAYEQWKWDEFVALERRGRSERTWIIEVALSALNKKDLKIVIQVRQPAVVSIGHYIWNGTKADLPATTQPQLPPPHTIISTSSGTVILSFELLFLACVDFVELGRISKTLEIHLNRKLLLLLSSYNPARNAEPQRQFWRILQLFLQLF
jgi:hypothetical protein